MLRAKWFPFKANYRVCLQYCFFNQMPEKSTCCDIIPVNINRYSIGAVAQSPKLDISTLDMADIDTSLSTVRVLVSFFISIHCSVAYKGSYGTIFF